ncbi:tetratricopeptide repeat protein [Marinimicrobium locisalis]|uniref:tetratricopeptide repeat protein n=1 Tax=Marinimicrobium locisalis TaxID=546022 RepID=UPI003221C15C
MKQGLRRLGLISVALLVPALSEAQEPADGRAALHEGVARYHYYQQDYLPALSELMVARERGQLDEGRGAILEGAIRLAFGMSGSARRQLDPALQDKPEQRAAATFYLGKLHYLRGNWRGATEVWSGMVDFNALAPELKREQRALEWQWRLRTDAPRAVEAEQLWDELGDWAPQILYNLGGAYARAGEHAQARDYYRALVDEAPSHFYSNTEYLALRDRAFTALGYSHLLAGEFARAEEAFDQVRLTRDETEQALLGYGWAALERGDPRTAVRAWQALSKRSLTQSAAQEALVALPYAYAQLEAPAAALEAYDGAERRLEVELARVRELARVLTADYLLAQLEHENTGDYLALRGQENWLTLTEETVAQSPDPYLSDWVNQSRFQSQVQALADLQDQDHLLASWPDKLSHYAELLRDKRALRQDRQADVAREALWQQAEELRRRRAPLADELARIEREGDVIALADADTRALYERTRNALARLDRLVAAGRTDEARERRARLELYQGILLWRAAQNYHANLWQTQKPLRQLDRALETLAERRERVSAIVNHNPDIGPTLERMAALEAQVEDQRARLREARQTRAQALAESLQGHLERHQQRLTQYLARVRLGAARLQDQALRAGEGAQ